MTIEVRGATPAEINRLAERICAAARPGSHERPGYTRCGRHADLAEDLLAAGFPEAFTIIRSSFAARVAVELATAREYHDPINSLHEGYAVILEEVDELWEQVRAKRAARSPERILEELVQIAAMVQRTAEDVLEPRAVVVKPTEPAVSPV